MSWLFDITHKNPELLALQLWETQGIMTLASLIPQISFGHKPFSQILPVFVLLEETIIYHSNFPDQDKKLAPTVLRNIIWSHLGEIAQKASFTMNPWILEKELQGLDMDKLQKFLGSIPEGIKGDKFDAILPSTFHQALPLYLEAAMAYKFGIYALFSRGDQGDIHYIWAAPTEGNNIKANFPIADNSLMNSLQNARKAATWSEGFCVFIDYPGGVSSKGIEGPSLGLAVFLCLLAQKNKKRIAPDLAVTGALVKKGESWNIGKVGNVPQKITAVKEYSEPFCLERVLVPRENEAEARMAADSQLEVITVESFKDLQLKGVFVEDRIRQMGESFKQEFKYVEEFINKEFSVMLQYS